MRRDRNWAEGFPGLSKRDRELFWRARETLQANILAESETSTHPLPWHPWRGICPSPFEYRGMWNWDSAFHAVGVSRWDPELAREQMRIFLDAQLPSGGLPDAILEDGTVIDAFGKPPVMPWATAIVDRRDPNDAFLSFAYNRFVAYETHWRRDRGGDADGLFHYDSLANDPEQKLTETKYESGWDNAVRWDNGIFELWPIDLNCYMVTLYRALAYMAERLSLPGQKKAWDERAKQLATRINAQLYDQDRGAYLDYNRHARQFSDVFSPASFMPLYIRIATRERAERMAALARDPKKLFPGIPTVAYDDPAYCSTGYWRGRTWLNVAYFALKGLKFYGCDAVADACRETILNWCHKNGDAIYENYDSRSGKGLGTKQFSWSAVFIIEFTLNWNAESSY